LIRRTKAQLKNGNDWDLVAGEIAEQCQRAAQNGKFLFQPREGENDLIS